MKLRDELKVDNVERFYKFATAPQTIEMLKAVIRKYDNKIINRRLDSALKDINGHIKYYINYDRFSIQYECYCEKIGDVDIDLCSLYQVKNTISEEDWHTTDLRLKADNVIKNIDKMLAINIATLKKIQEQRSMIDDIQDNYNREKATMDKIWCDILYPLRGLFET